VKGRPAQRRRTRAALLAAAVHMVREGDTVPSVAAVAAAADVSRRTAYRYFPTAEQMATEAVLETLGPHLDPAVVEAHRSQDVPKRVAATVRRMQRGAVENERLLRTMIRLTVGRTPPAAGGRHPASRGSRRVGWLEEAIRPLRGRLGKATYGRLLSALSLCVGAEALIVLRDVRGLGTEEAIEVSVWAADALVRAAGGSRPRR
jgi:AcrR family transcriptional regulator